MAKIYVDKDENIDYALKRFKRKVLTDGDLAVLREKEYFVSKGEKRRNERKQAKRRAAIQSRNERRY